jgi:hypothetical protein
MATTTPNYGWPVPTDTDYVKDGAAAIEALGDAIDATVFGLSGGILNVRDEKPNNTAGGTASTGNNIRVLNTVVTNTITGASLASNEITLPAGTYTIFASAPSNYANSTRIRLVNVTDSVVLLLGTIGFANAGTDYAQSNSLINGSFTLAGTKALNITHYFTSGGSGKLGAQINDTFVAVFTNVFITKIG